MEYVADSRLVAGKRYAPIEVAQKVHTIRLVPGDKPGKMARLIARDTVVGTLEVLECSQLELDAEMHALW